MKQKFFLFLATSLLLLFAGADIVYRDMLAPLELEEDKIVEVLYGDSVYRVADKLAALEILQYPRLWVWYARANGQAEKIKAGEYKIQSGKNSLDILRDMVNGDAIKYTLTFIEGWTTAQAIRKMQDSPGIVKTLEPDDHEIILKSINAEEYYSHSEGLFFPDTYHYTRGTKDRDILQKAYRRLTDELNTVWENRQENLPYQNPYEILIMASIIEKETGVDKERPQIAGVFVERMRRGMRLQTDPTVIYGMGSKYKGNITRRDLITPTPYNTYVIDRLPPTPISLVSKASLEAAVKPVLNGDIFFVAKGNGYHVFSKNLADHERAVREYQLRRQEEYRSSPACENEPCDAQE